LLYVLAHCRGGSGLCGQLDRLSTEFFGNCGVLGGSSSIMMTPRTSHQTQIITFFCTIGPLGVATAGSFLLTHDRLRVTL
jgi:hypothetical protein